MQTAILSINLPRLRSKLRVWLRKNSRILPWRTPFHGRDPLTPEGTTVRRSPYAVWISEIMLQQTQVATVIPYFKKWMIRFPNLATLAIAEENLVLQSWAGLGYYSRAKNILRAARIFSKQGFYPVKAEDWRTLPGIGPYTAGAISSLAYDLPEPILDGNVIRVLSRLYGLPFLPTDSVGHRKEYWRLAGLWAAGRNPGETNEALMELGALVCLPLSPCCRQCPLAFSCQAQKQGLQDSLPPAKIRPRAKVVTGVVVIAENHRRFLVRTNPVGGILAGHDLFLMFLGDEEGDWQRKTLKSVPGWKWGSVPKEAGFVNHSIMNRKYVLRVFCATLLPFGNKTRKVHNPSIKWIHGTNLESTFTNALVRKVWKVAKDQGL